MADWRKLLKKLEALKGQYINFDKSGSAEDALEEAIALVRQAQADERPKINPYSDIMADRIDFVRAALKAYSAAKSTPIVPTDDGVECYRVRDVSDLITDLWHFHAILAPSHSLADTLRCALKDFKQEQAEWLARHCKRQASGTAVTIIVGN